VTDEGAAPRRAFVAEQIGALEPLDFLVVGVPVPPFDAVQVLREADGGLAVVVSGRAKETPFTAEQLAALAKLGFPAPAPDGGRDDGLRAPEPTADAAAASALVDTVLTEVFAVDAATPVDVRHGSGREAHAADQKLQEIRACIEPVLESILGKPAPQDDDGDYLVDVGNARVFVAPRVLPGRPPPIIRIFAITNAGMNLTPELGLFLARLNFDLMFGRFSIDAANSAIWFDETLLGDHVSDEELRFTVEMVATTANEWDQKIGATFGGRTRSASPAAADEPPAKPGQGGYL
jgi:hypothetical protein